MSNVIEVDFVERKRKKVMDEIKDEAEREIKQLAGIMSGEYGGDPTDGLVMPLPDLGVDLD